MISIFSSRKERWILPRVVRPVCFGDASKSDVSCGQDDVSTVGVLFKQKDCNFRSLWSVVSTPMFSLRYLVGAYDNFVAIVYQSSVECGF